jgi:D-3-phosphoglycerate dehydrogenase
VKITGKIADINVNISDMINKSRGNYAYNIIDIDSEVDEKELLSSLNFEGVISVRIIR